MSVLVVATGGTISSHFDGTDWQGLSGAALVAELGDLSDLAPCGVDVVDAATGPSSNLGFDDILAIARRVATALDDGATGVVVLHGTDTLELTAFTTQLLLGTTAHRRPVVLTGSMRVHSHPSPDGPRNLRDAIAVAASDTAVGREVLVCLEGALHAADRVVKRSAASVDAFDSAPLAPVGRVVDGRITFTALAEARTAARGFVTDVPLVTCYPGITGDAVAAAIGSSPGAVVEAFGDLNMPFVAWSAVHGACANGSLVAVASRPFTPTRSSEGLELSGAVGAGGLTAQKARLAVMAALGTGDTRPDAIAFLHQYALRYDAGERRTSS